MKQKIKMWLVVFLCLALMLTMGACRDAGGGAEEAESSSQSALTAQTLESQTSEVAKETKKQVKETKDQEEKKETKEQAETRENTAAKNDSTKASKAKESTKTANSKSSKKETQTIKPTKEKKPSGHVLTVKKNGKEIYFTEGDLAKLGKVSYKYSYRNKDSEHRQFETCTGVTLSSVLGRSGFSGSRLRFRSKDGYTREFSVGELKASKKAFLKTSGSSAKSVPAILTTSGSESFRLVFGQSGDDTDESGDYNAQYWIKWVESIEIL